MLRTFVVAFTLVWTAAADARATKGVVVYDRGCSSRIIIETSLGYVLAEWYGGGIPYEGDTLVGEINSYGMKDLFILNRDRDTRLWIDDYMLSRRRVVEKLRDKCPDL